MDIQSVIEGVLKEFEANGNVSMQIQAKQSNGNLQLVVIPEGLKPHSQIRSHFLKWIRAKFLCDDVVEYFFISEVWTLKSEKLPEGATQADYDKAYTQARKDLDENYGGLIKNHPNKQELLMIGHHTDTLHDVYAYEIIRDGDKVTLGEQNKMEDTTGDYAHLLAPKAMRDALPQAVKDAIRESMVKAGVS